MPKTEVVCLSCGYSYSVSYLGWLLWARSECPRCGSSRIASAENTNNCGTGKG